MVVLSQLALDQFIKTCKPNTIPPNIIPTIDLSNPNAKSMVVNACKEFGFFKVENHGIPIQIMSQLEDEACKFFSLPLLNKESAGIANPFGYGNKHIGRNGDVGWIEYLLLSASPDFISQISVSIYPHNPHLFRYAIMNYLTKVKKMGVQILEMIAEGLNAKKEEKNIISKMIKDEKSDSYIRLNHYPPRPEEANNNNNNNNNNNSNNSNLSLNDKNMVGFGEHTDPQILSILRSNDTPGLQICLHDGNWVSVPPDHNSFFILVGDSLQVMTNGRFKSVKHRVLADNKKSRISTIFFAGPPLSEKIAPLPCIMQPNEETLYQEFTWREYKNSAYNSRLSDNRLLSFLKNKK